VEQPTPGNEFQGSTLIDLAKELLGMRRISTKGMTRDQIARKILNVHTTSDFPLLLADLANKALRAAYENFEHNWRAIARTTSVTDFKPLNLIQLGSFNSLAEIPEGGEYQYGTVGEEREQVQAVTKGRAMVLSRQMLINDDLNGFSRRGQLLGRAAARTVAADVFSVLTDNPTMSDGTVLFHADHGNLAASGGAISEDTLSAAKAAMRMQRDPNDRDYLNIMPRILLVPVALEDTANQYMTSTSSLEAEANSGVTNPHRGSMQVVSDPYLDANDTNGWYIMADPNDVATVVVAFLNGQETPFTDDMVDFDTDALLFKVRLDYGTAAEDFRGAYYNNGGA